MIRGDKLTIKLQQNSSGTVNKVIAATTSCNADVSAEALEATSQDSGLFSEFVGGKLSGTISGDFLVAVDGEQYTNLYTHAGSGDQIEWELFRDGEAVIDGTGVISTISEAGGNSDVLSTGAYSLSVSVADEVTPSEYSTQYQTVYDYFTSKPSSAVATNQDTMVRALVSAGVWAKLDLLYILAGHTNGANESYLNWMSPGDYTLSESEGTTKAFTALEGSTGSGDGRLTTGWNTSTHAVNYTQNSASLGCYIRTNVGEGGFDLGLASGRRGQIASRYAGDVYYANICGGASTPTLNAATTDSRGFHIINRVDSSTMTLYKNASLIDTESASASGALASEVLFIHGYTTALYSTKQISVVFAGAKLDGTEITALTNAVETYMDSNGKGVIT